MQQPLNRTELLSVAMAEFAKISLFRRKRFVGRQFPGSTATDVSIELLDRLDEPALEQLGRFFDYGKTTGVAWPEPGLRIFASHLSSTRGRFANLKSAFASYGANLFFAHDDIEGGALWRQSLLDALWTMDALLAIHSPGYGASSFCNQEIGIALYRDVPVVSVMDGEAPCGFINEAQGIPHRQDEPQLLVEKTLKVIAMRSPGSFAEAFARALKYGNSYGHIDILVNQLGTCASLTAEALDDIDLAVRFNDQVYGSGNDLRLGELAQRLGSSLSSLNQHATEPDGGCTVLASDFDLFKV